MKKQNIFRRRGDTTPVMLSVKDYLGEAVDITGATFKLTVNSEEFPSGTTNQKFQAVGSIVSAPDGTVTFPIGTADSASAGEFYYDVQMTDATSKIETIAAGRFILTQDITKT